MAKIDLEDLEDFNLTKAQGKARFGPPTLEKDLVEQRKAGQPKHLPAIQIGIERF